MEKLKEENKTCSVYSSKDVYFVNYKYLINLNLVYRISLYWLKRMILIELI